MGAGRLIRFASRTAAFSATTLGSYAALDIETLFSKKNDHPQVLFKWIARYGRACLKIYGFEIAAEGPHVADGHAYPGTDENGLGRIFIMNHRSGMDIPILLTSCEAHIVSRADLGSWPLIGMAARRAGTLFVDRSSKRSGASVLKQMTRTLQAGRGVALFPEGTAFGGDEVRPLQSGAFKAAQLTGASIIPLGLAYASAETTYGEESFVTHMKRVSSMPRLEVALQIGEPISPEGLALKALREQARTRLQTLVDRARARLDARATERSSA